MLKLKKKKVPNKVFSESVTGLCLFFTGLQKKIQFFLSKQNTHKNTHVIVKTNTFSSLCSEPKVIR